MSRQARYRFEADPHPEEYAGAIRVMREELDALGDLGPGGHAAILIPSYTSLDDLRAKIRATFAASC